MRDRTKARSSTVTFKLFDTNLIHDTVMASGIWFTRDLFRSICSTCVSAIYSTTLRAPSYSACPVLLCPHHTLKVRQPHAAEANLVKATRRRPTPNRLHKLRALITPGELDNGQVQLLVLEQRATTELIRNVLFEAPDRLLAIHHVREDGSRPGAPGRVPHRDGETGIFTLGKIGGTRADPVGSVGVGGEGEATTREGDGVRRDGAGGVDAAGSQDGERV